MDLRELRYYCSIIENQQISKAAKTLHMTQPALSRCLKELEESLQTTLIVRGGRNWQVTEAGEVLYARAKDLIQQLEQLPTEINDSTLPYNATILIGASSICFSYLAASIAKINKVHPQIHFRLFYGDIAYLEDLVLKRKVDLSIYIQATARRDELTYLDLPQSTYSVVYPAGVLPVQPSFKLKDLKCVPLIVPRRSIGGGIYQYILDQLQAHLGYNPIMLDSQDIQTLPLFLDYGVQAATLLPTTEVHQHLRDRYHVSLLDEPDLITTPYIVHRKDQYLSKATRTLIDELLRYQPQADYHSKK